MVAVPAETAVMRPLLFTVATAGALLLHDPGLLLALAGATVAVSVSVAPGAKVTAVVLSVTPVTATVLLPFTVTIAQLLCFEVGWLALGLVLVTVTI